MSKSNALRMSYFQAGLKNTTPKSEISTQEYHIKVKNGEVFKQQQAFFNATNAIEKQKIKLEKVPFVTAQALVSERTKEGVIKRTGLIGLDIDKLDDALKTMLVLREDKLTFIVHRSISHKGLRLFVLVNTDQGEHLEYFLALENYIHKKYGFEIDKACKDISRAFLLAHDPEAYMNEEAVTIGKEFINEYLPKEAMLNVELNPKPVGDLKLSPAEKSYYGEQKLNMAINMIKKAKDGSKHDTVLKMARMLGTYVLYGFVDDKTAYSGLKEAVDSRKESIADMDNAYKTIRDGIEYGYMNPFDVRKEVVTRDQMFWEVRKPNTDQAYLEIMYVGLYKLLNKHGYWLYKKDASNFLVHMKDNILSEVDKHDMIRFMMKYIEDLPYDIGSFFNNSDLLETFRRKINMLFADNQLYSNMPCNPQFNRDTKDGAYLYFNNEIVKVSRDGIDILQYDELTGCIWKDQIINRDFDERIPEYEYLLPKCIFARFVKGVVNHDEMRFRSLCTIIGYLLHGYKDPKFAKAVILCDELISEFPNGGTGKGIFLKALSQLKKVVLIDGKNVKFSSQFLFQQVNLNTELIVFEDVLEDFDFEKLFSAITEGLNVEKKNKDKFHIPFQESPKVLILTNFMIMGEGNSHERRKIEFEFSQHFNKNHTPEKEFGHVLYSDWDNYQWGLFDQFMVHCLQEYLKHGVIEAPQININRRKLLQDTCSEFTEFAFSKIAVGKEYDKSLLMGAFQNRYEEFGSLKWFTLRTFIRWLKAFGKCNGLEVKERVSNNKRLITFMK